MQQFLINNLLQPLGRLSAKWSEKARECILVLCFFLMFVQVVLSGMDILPWRYFYVILADCFLLGVTIVCTAAPMMKAIKLEPLLWWSYIAFCVLLLVSSFVDGYDSIGDALLGLVGFPLCFISWWNYGYDKLIRRFCRAGLICGYLYFIGSYLLRPVTEERYTWLDLNQNGAASFLCFVFLCALFFFVQTQGKKQWWYLTVMALCSAAVFYTASRTGEIALLLALAAAVVLRWGCYKKKQWLAFALFYLAALFIFVFGLVYLMQTRKWIDLPLYLNATTQWVSVEDIPQFASDCFFGIGKNIQKTGIKYDMRQSADFISTGRLSTWKKYLSYVGFRGHRWDLRPETLPLTTHMTALQYAYSNGVLCGIAWILVNIASGICCLKKCVQDRKNIVVCFSLCAALSYGFTSYLASMTMTMFYVLPMAYFVALGGLLKKDEKAAEREMA